MVHQIYSIIQDHTTVDRTLAQLIKDGTIKKFYLGGTGSDEFAIMLTSDYVALIQQAKEQYLKDTQDVIDQQEQASITSSNSTSKRKLATSKHLATSKKLVTENAIIDTDSKIRKRMTSASTNLNGQSDEGVFVRFKDLVNSGHCMEISIQHSNIQSYIGATDQDITTLIRYSLLNRSLSAPANPHLVNLNQPEGRGNNASSGSGISSHSALNQLIHATNQEQAKTVKSETTMVSSLPSISTSAQPAPTMTITATLGRRERISDDVAYRFAIPQGGFFVTHLLKGRLDILRMIKRQTFGDMLTSAVVSKPLRGSFLPHEFHIHDIVGSGRVQRFL
ncbi:hypothetical protein BGX27_003780 [Mortierella sp. AM989]|nr:hypothetical protein BGX27_003780 [Mortierella sp. AM989]